MSEDLNSTMAFLASPEGREALRAFQQVDAKIVAGFQRVIAEHWGEYREALRLSLDDKSEPDPRRMLAYIFSAFVVSTRVAIEEHIGACCFPHMLTEQVAAIELGATLAMQKQGLQERERQLAEAAAAEETKH